jgi:HNH endonuclease
VSDRTCTIDACDKAFYSRGWCLRHYKRWKRHGDPRGGYQRVFIRGDDDTRFWSKVAEGESPACAPHLGRCWVWQTNKDGKGYGVFMVSLSSHKQAARRAHRWAYEAMVDKIPDGLVIDHLCRNTSCVNPGHLEPVTPKTNIQRGETSAWQRAKTHCPHDHAYTLANTGYDRGSRYCRTCVKIRRDQRKLKRGRR